MLGQQWCSKAIMELCNEGGGIRLKSLCILWLAVIGWTVQCKDMGMHWQRREVSKLFSFLAPFFGLSGLCIE